MILHLGSDFAISPMWGRVASGTEHSFPSRRDELVSLDLAIQKLRVPVYSAAVMVCTWKPFHED